MVACASASAQAGAEDAATCGAVTTGAHAAVVVACASAQAGAQDAAACAVCVVVACA
jgi:hypothetical protein